mgnify:CR=1 FL=1
MPLIHSYHACIDAFHSIPHGALVSFYVFMCLSNFVAEVLAGAQAFAQAFAHIKVGCGSKIVSFVVASSSSFSNSCSHSTFAQFFFIASVDVPQESLAYDGSLT